MKRFLKRSAFTIVEMVIVIAVIGILATVMIPTISGMIENANKSADTQFTASLTIQLAVESVDDGINSEADLRRIVDQYYGEWDGDTLVTSYYDTKLVPKAAKSGNHFWYNVVDGSVVAGDFDYVNNLPGPASATDGVPSEPPAPDFEKANPRTIKTKNGNYFFLMDCGGSEIVGDVFNALSGCPDSVAVGLAFDALNAPDYTDADNELAATVLEKLLKTGVLTNAGLIAGSTNLEYIYVPAGTTRQGSGTYLYNGTEVASSSRGSITIPANYAVDLPAGSMFGEDSLKGFPDSTLLNIPTDDVSKLGDFFEPNSAYISGSTADNTVKSFTIVLANGARYGQDEAGSFYLLNADGTMGDAVSGVTSGYKQELESFKVGLDSTANKKLYIKTEGNILYIANDYTGDLILSANDFKDTEGNTMTPGRVTWHYENTTGAQTAIGEKLTVAANTLKDGSTLTVQVQGQPKKMTAKLVKIEHTWVDTVGGKSPTDYDANDKPIYTLSYDATQGGSWNFAPGFSTTDGIGNGADEAGHIVMDAEPYFSSSSEKLSNNENKIVIGKFETNVACNINDTVTFGYGSARETVTINLVDTSKATFAVNSSIQTQMNYGLGNYAIGTKGAAITWGDLFQRTAHVSGQKVILAYDYNGTPFKTEVYGADWEGQQVDFTGVSGNPAITVKIAVAATENDTGEVIAGEWCPLDIRVIAGAYNVKTADDWKDVPSGKTDERPYSSIVVLSDFTLTYNESNAEKKGINTQYSKDLGDGKIYGNYYTISVPKFYVRPSSKANCYFLSFNGGELNNVLIEGPSYGSNVSVLQSDSTSKGTFVSGLYASSVTINNSYISGFREALRANGGTVTISNSTLKGGNWANIYVHGNTTFNLTNVTTIQYEENDFIGVGIFLNNTATSNTLNINGLTQHNYMTKAQLEAILKKTTSNMGSISNSDVKKFSDVLHGSAYHTGFILWGEDGTSAAITVNQNNENYVQSSKLDKSILFGVYKRSITVYGLKTCSTCNHSSITSYTAKDNFLPSKLVK